MKKKKILFRADGNSDVGLGHLYRLLALFEIFKEEYACIFLTKENSTLSVFSEDVNVFTIPVNIETNDEPNWIETNFNPENYHLFIDGYQFGIDYQSKLKHLGYKFLYVDDYAKDEVVANIIVNHSMAVNEKDYAPYPIKTKLALGSKYAILRPMLLEEAKNERVINAIDNVFICFGGADFNNLTLRCLKGVLKINAIKNIHVVLGNAYQQKEIYKIIEDNKTRVLLHERLNEKQMINLMKKCHLAIIPSSTISYEVCSVKMIALCGYYIDNQIKIYNGLKRNNLIFPAENFNEMEEKDFENSIQRIIDDNKKNHQIIIDNQKKYFDGHQKKRFLNLIKKLDYAS